MRRVSTKFVLKLLMMEQKQLHLEASQNMLDYANSDPESNIPEAKKGQASAAQRQSDVDRFL